MSLSEKMKSKIRKRKEQKEHSGIFSDDEIKQAKEKQINE